MNTTMQRNGLQQGREVLIKAPQIESCCFKIVGTAPYVQARFSKKAEIMAIHTQENKGSKKKIRKARDFDKEYKDAMYISADGWYGIPASSFRAAMISACRLVGFKMTIAKMSVFVKADGYDKNDNTSLIKIKGDPIMDIRAVRNATGVMDLRARPMFKKWSAEVTFEYDADQFSLIDVANLISRVGVQVGVGEGRPDSRESAGMGWGTFKVLGKEDNEN